MADSDAGSSAPPQGGVVGDVGAPQALRKVKKQKVLLMGKSGSGKSSMRSIIFSNYLARDTRRLGATIDIDLSHVKFLGNLTLNLWDCGGQEAFMENYLSQQRAHVFSNVGVLIYVFDIESRDVERDLATYVNIMSALVQYSRDAKVFILVHKMDLVQPQTREEVFEARVALIRRKTLEAVALVRKQQQKPDNLISPMMGMGIGYGGMGMGAMADAGGGSGTADSSPDLGSPVSSTGSSPVEGPSIIEFATSIWDQSLYKAWARIIHDLVPNLSVIKDQLNRLGEAIDADEVLLFERTSFLVVSHWRSPEGDRNPFGDRFERMSNILKSWKHSCSKFTGLPRNAEQFSDFEYKMGRTFSMFVTKFTTNTYILVCMPPGEARFNSAKLNVYAARPWFKFLDGPSVVSSGGGAPAAMTVGSSQGAAAAGGYYGGTDYYSPGEG